MDEKSCREACNALHLPQNGMQCDDHGYGCKCYKDRIGICYLDGSLEGFTYKDVEKDLIENGSSMICKLRIGKKMHSLFQKVVMI